MEEAHSLLDDMVLVFLQNPLSYDFLLVIKAMRFLFSLFELCSGHSVCQ